MKPTFIDVFAGCGGLSLGLMQSGWQGIFAIERDANAFATLRHNLIKDADQERRCSFDWPENLPKEPMSIADILGKHRENVSKLEGKVDVLVGGPPCQGFSTAGRRDPHDPRNQLSKSYLELVKILRPKVVIVENVKGITADFVNPTTPNRKKNYAEWLKRSLTKEYSVHAQMLDLSTFGVPQRRNRFFLVALRKGCFEASASCPFEHIESKRAEFLKSKQILSLPVSVEDAISDLEVTYTGTGPSRDTIGFQEIKHSGTRTQYQRVMNGGDGKRVADTRLAKHRPHIIERFQEIIESCKASGRLNLSLAKDLREKFGLHKLSIRVLDNRSPSPTITSMPDDLIHYNEPRCLTVRENARLQSFPDWFEFKGTYTTGGLRRRSEVPRFTQVANAVPPLAAEAIGNAIRDYVSRFVAEEISLKNV